METTRTTGSDGREYQVTEDGTWYHADTPAQVIMTLQACRKHGTRIRLYYGHADGKSWGERYDVTGKISRSMGPIKIPLLVYSRRSMGGTGLFGDCVVAIRLSSKVKGEEVWLYRHPDFEKHADDN
jgi:hypothetical protein